MGREMLRKLGYESLEEMTDAAVPKRIKLNRYLSLDEPLSEMEVLQKIKGIANRNQVRYAEIVLFSSSYTIRTILCDQRAITDFLSL